MAWAGEKIPGPFLYISTSLQNLHSASRWAIASPATGSRRRDQKGSRKRIEVAHPSFVIRRCTRNCDRRVAASYATGAIWEGEADDNDPRARRPACRAVLQSGGAYRVNGGILPRVTASCETSRTGETSDSNCTSIEHRRPIGACLHLMPRPGTGRRNRRHREPHRHAGEPGRPFCQHH